MACLASLRLFLVFLALFAVWPAYAAFTDNGNGTITDSETGLVWDKCAWGQTWTSNTCTATTDASLHTWAQALAVAVTANGGSHRGHVDWRLPNKNELESLVNIDVKWPAIDTAAFPNTPFRTYWEANVFWTSTTAADASTHAWIVNFANGYILAYVKSSTHYVRLVRSGQPFASFESDLTAPAYQSAALNAARTAVTLTFNEALTNNLGNLAALKAAITFAADGTNFVALAAGDTVALSGATLIVTFAAPLTGDTNKLKLAANSIKDASGNVLASAVTTASLDAAPPVYQSAALNAGLTVATLTFNEALTNNLGNLAALKAAVTFAADGTNFVALAAGDTVALSGATLTVTFAAPLTGDTNKLKLAANSLKDASGNVLASAVTTAMLDAAPPVYQSAALNAGLTVVTLSFDQALTNNLADLDALKAAVTFAADGNNFAALAAGDTVAIADATLIITFAAPLAGNTNTLNLAANSLKDASGNVLASAVTTAALDAVDTVPDAFSFTAQTDVTLSTLTTSNPVTVAGINTAAAISINGGSYSINGGTYTAAAGTVNNGDSVAVQQTSSSSFGVLTTATLSIGGVDGAFDVTTLPPVVSYTAPAAQGTGDITASFSGGGAGCGYSVSQYIPLTGHPASPPAGTAPAGVLFPHGLFDFTTSGCTPGSTITMVIAYPQALPAGTTYWKYGPTPTDGSYHWYQLPAVIDGNTATFSITDGDLGDDDLTPNGIIVDQGGPGVPVIAIPTLSEWVLLLLAGLMGLFGVGAMRRPSSGRPA